MSSGFRSRRRSSGRGRLQRLRTTGRVERRGAEQRSGETAAAAARQRVLGAERVELADDRAAQVLAVGLIGGERREQRVEALLGLAAVERGEGLGLLSFVLEAQPRGQAVGLEVADDRLEQRAASSRSPRAIRMRASGTAAAARPGSSSTARRSSSSLPPATSRSASEGTSESKNSSTAGRGWAPTNSPATRRSANALTDGIPRIWKAWASIGLASVSSFASTTSPSRAAAADSSSGVSWRHGPHHSAQKSTTTGSSTERSTTSRSKSASVTSIEVTRTA